MNHSFMFFVLGIIGQLILISCNTKVSVTQPSESVEKTTLYVDSNPRGAEIFLNGLNTAKITPDSITYIESGSYEIKLRLYPYANIDSSISIDPVQPSYLYMDFETSDNNLCQIEVISTPAGAEIFLNNETTGLFTPDTIKSIWFNDYMISCSFPEHRSASKEISLVGGEFKTVNLVLQDTSMSVDYNPSNSTFPTYHVSTVVVDKNDVVWAACWPGAIVKYKDGKFATYNSSNSPVLLEYINCIIVDDNNVKWMGTNRGLISLDDSENWNSYNTYNSDIPVDAVTALAVDSHGDLWMGLGGVGTTAKHIGVFDGSEWSSWLIPGNRYVLSLAVDDNDVKYVGLDYSFYLFDNGEWIYPEIDFYESPNLRSRGIATIAFTGDNGILLGCESMQYFLYPGGLYRIRELFAIPISVSLLKESHVSNIYCAENGNIWISSLGKYPYVPADDNSTILIKLDHRLYPTTFYSMSNTGINSTHIMQTAAQLNGDLWLASRDKGLIKFKNANNN